MAFAYTNILPDCDWSEICILNWVKRKKKYLSFKFSYIKLDDRTTIHFKNIYQLIFKPFKMS